MIERSFRRSRFGWAAALPLVLLMPLPAGASAAPNQQQASQQARAQQPGSIEVIAARQLIDRPVRDEQGRDAGRIDSIVLDTENGAVDFVVIAGDGNFDLNGQVIAVPWSSLAPPGGSGPITIKVSVDKLLKAPRLNGGALSELDQPRVRSNLYGYYGYRGRPAGYVPYGPNGRPNAAGYAGYGAYGGYGYDCYACYYPAPYPGGPRPAIAARRNGGNAGSSAAANQGGGSNVADNGGNQAGDNSNAGGANNANPTGQALVRYGLAIGANGAVSTMESPTTASAGAMHSASVFTPDGNQIGGIDQVLIDTQHGEVAFVLIERGGFLGLSPQWFAVPIEALIWAPYQGGYRLTVNERALASEPAVPVNENHLPTKIQTNQLAQLYTHFGVKPYWQPGAGQSEAASTSSQKTSPQNGAAAGSGGSQQPAGSK